MDRGSGRNKKRLIFLGLVGAIFIVLGCNACKTHSPTPYSQVQPEGFVAMVQPPDNPMTKEGVELGRALFFDPILSGDSTVACLNCHRPFLAFTDGTAFSKGIKGRQTKRSSPSLLNVGFKYQGMFWDGRSPTLEDQAGHPIADTSEMGAAWPVILGRLAKHPDYPTQFKAAFGERRPTEANVRKALAQYQRSLVSSNSLFDKVTRGEATFSPAQERGYKIFFDLGAPELPTGECSHCHIEPLFTDLSYQNNGLDLAEDIAQFKDPGRGGVTGNRADFGKFAVPSLRNVAVTAPYMHDGRFTSLEQVVAHYNSGGHYSENRSPNVRPLHMSAQDQADLIAFLRTLTDYGSR